MNENHDALTEKVRAILQRMQLIEGDVLEPLDSLSIVLLAAELETQLLVEIPPTLYRAEHFQSIETMTQMLAGLGAR
jgi:acyl carrier protein